MKIGGHRLLIVEDEPLLRITMADALRKEGWTVDVAEDGVKGAALFEQHLHDMVLTDLVMPRLGGLDLLYTRTAICAGEFLLAFGLTEPGAGSDAGGTRTTAVRDGDEWVLNGVDLVFVLGHPGYYPRHGFRTAGVLGFDAPYPIPAKDADAWMVQELRPGFIGKIKGPVACAAALDHPEHWRE